MLLPFVAALFSLNSMTKERLFLFLAVLLGMMGESAMRIARNLWQNNMPVVHIYTMVEFLLLFSVFYYGKSRLFSAKSYKSVMIMFVVIAIGNMVFYQGIWNDNSIIRSLEGIILMICAIYYFFDLLRGLNVLNPEKAFMFWFSTAVLMYFGGNILLHWYSNHLAEIAMESSEKLVIWKQVWYINYVLNIFLYLFYGIAFLCKESKTIQTSS